MQEYILHPIDDVEQYLINCSIVYPKKLVIASFCFANISTVNPILRRLNRMKGLKKVESIRVTSETRIYQEGLVKE